ncbi:MAG: hypothetical protein AABY93_14520 [Bacteroidota bacterium]
MPSLIPTFQYDIFISYRHNDNRSGWVNEFVRGLEEEPSGTIKEKVSVYFPASISFTSVPKFICAQLVLFSVL